MDHDLLLDLRHLDDPEPPGFGTLRAEEAARRAADRRSRRAGMVAGLVLVLALVAGIGVARLGGGDDDRFTALAGRGPASQPASGAEPATSVPGTSDPLLPPPTTAVPVAPGAGTTLPGPPAPSPGVTVRPAPPTSTTAGPSNPGPTLAPAEPVGVAPEGSGPLPNGVRFTLTLDSRQVAAGATVRGVVRFENGRSNPVTVGGGGCTAQSKWRPDLYKAGKPVPTAGVDCMMYTSTLVGPGGVEEVVVELRASPDLAPGTYDAFSVVTLEEDHVRIPSAPVAVTVVRP